MRLLRFSLAGLGLAVGGAQASRAVGSVEPDLRFGVATHFAQGWNPAWIDAVTAVSAPTVRDELYWNAIETVPGEYVFPEEFDSYMAGLQRAGIAPLIVLDFANANYDGGATPYTAAGCAAYTRYVLAVLRHYGPQIKTVEIWNEYNGTFCTGPAALDRANSYLRMLKLTYAAIKSARPDVVVVAGATAGIPQPYWESLLAGGVLDSLDVISVHPYRYDAAPEGLEGEIADLRALVRLHAPGNATPIWVTEIGWMTKASQAAGDLAIDEGLQAKFLVRGYALLLSAGVERVYWYLLRDEPDVPMGLVVADGRNSPKAAATALATMIRELQGSVFVQREASDPLLYSLLFHRADGTEERVMWALSPITVARGGAAVRDLQGSPVAPADLLPLDGSPVYVDGALPPLPPPAPAPILLADAGRDFSNRQGGAGWSYGTFTASSSVFTPLPTFTVTDWTKEWTGVFPFISVTATDQHPSVAGLTPVSAVRRWTADRAGPIDVSGSFHCGLQGDGVGVSIWIGGQRVLREALGGGNGIEKDFSLQRTVAAGTPIDFAVDPGPGANIDFDATALAVTITAPPETTPAPGAHPAEFHP